MLHKFAAGIVLFNPNISRLQANIESIIDQVGLVILFDNGSININEIEKIIDMNFFEKIKLVKSNKNRGIAYALNDIVKEAEVYGYEWVLTLDQDSITQKGTIQAFNTYIHENKVAIICPYIVDKRRKNIEYKVPSERFTNVKFCITSGSLINIKICKLIGGFDEWLFIGLVDNDYCKRIELLGYKILQVNSIVLDHELGNLTPSKFEDLYLKLGKILKLEIIRKLSYKRDVNQMRLYYATRNMIYMIKKYKRYNNNKKAVIFIIINCVSSILRGKNKLKLLKWICLGIKDGLKKKVDAFIIKK